MSQLKALVLCGAAMLVAFAPHAAAAVINPFTKDFASSTSNWRKDTTTSADYVATGGPLGASDAYISHTRNLGTATGSQAIFRGQASFNPIPSDGAFVGNWISSGVKELSYWIRHDAPVAMPIFVRLAAPENFPAMSAFAPTDIAPNVWTRVVVAIDPANPALQPEGTDFATNFSNIGNVVFFTERGAVPENTVVTFGLDKISVVPEPATMAMAALGAFYAMTSRRRPQGR